MEKVAEKSLAPVVAMEPAVELETGCGSCGGDVALRELPRRSRVASGFRYMGLAGGLLFTVFVFARLGLAGYAEWESAEQRRAWAAIDARNEALRQEQERRLAPFEARVAEARKGLFTEDEARTSTHSVVFGKGDLGLANVEWRYEDPTQLARLIAENRRNDRELVWPSRDKTARWFRALVELYKADGRSYFIHDCEEAAARLEASSTPAPPASARLY